MELFKERPYKESSDYNVGIDIFKRREQIEYSTLQYFLLLRNITRIKVSPFGINTPLKYDEVFTIPLKMSIEYEEIDEPKLSSIKRLININIDSLRESCKKFHEDFQKAKNIYDFLHDHQAGYLVYKLIVEKGMEHQNISDFVDNNDLKLDLEELIHRGLIYCDGNKYFASGLSKEVLERFGIIEELNKLSYRL